MWTDGKRMPTNGSVEPFRDFLVPRISRLVIIDGLVPGSEDVMPKIEEYTNQNMVFKKHESSWWMYLMWPILKLSNKHGTRTIFKIRDFLSVLDWSMRDNTRFDYFVGLESIYGLAGIILRKMGRVKKVAYYVSDYSPTRYSHGWFNNLYLVLDRFCAMHADFIWDVSTAFQPTRIKFGLDPKRSAPVVNVPNGLFPEQITVATVHQIQPYSLVFMGTLGEENGPDLAIEILPLVLKRYPQTTLHVVGGGKNNLGRLKTLAKSLNVLDKVKFRGFIVDSGEMSRIVSKCFIALAPYRAFPDSIRYYGDATKIRTYAAAGLPVITSSVPPLGRELYEFGGALMVRDSKQDFAKAVISIFSDKRLYAKLRKQAIKFAKTSTWDNRFTQAFAQSQ